MIQCYFLRHRSYVKSRGQLPAAIHAQCNRAGACPKECTPLSITLNFHSTSCSKPKMGYSHHPGVRLSSLTESDKKFSAIMEPIIPHHFHKRPALDLIPQSSSHPHNLIPLRFILILLSSLSQFSN